MFPVIWSSFEYWRKQLRMKPEAAADLGCGTGSFIEQLSKFAPRVYGLDCSPWMLKIARKKIFRPNVAIFKQDFRYLALPERVDLITANFDTLNYVTSGRDLRRVFDACHRCLKSRGHFYFDVLTGDGERPEAGPKKQFIRLPRICSSWTIRTGRNGSRAIIRSVGRNADGSITRETECHAQRWYPSLQIERLLKQHGFSVLGTYRFGSVTPAHSDAFWIQVIAQKRTNKQ